MPNIKISELTALTPPDAADLVPVTDASASQTKRTTLGEIVGIINGDVDVADNGTATISELPVSKLQDGSARQLLQTDAAGTGVEWTSNVDLPGTLDVTGAATFDSTASVAGDLAVNTNTLFVDVSANAVGVGTASLLGELHVAGSDANTDLFITEGSTNTDARIRNSNGVLLLDADVNNENSGSSVVIGVDGSERCRVDSSGRLLVGTSSAYAVASGFSGVKQQIVGNDAASFLRYSADNLAETLWFCKSRSVTVGQHTVVQNGDAITRFNFQASDGTNFITAARIDAEVDGTPGTNDMPGRLVFSTTADGASSPTERMRITNGGAVSIGTANPEPSYMVTVAGDASGGGAGGIAAKADGTGDANFFSTSNTIGYHFYGLGTGTFYVVNNGDVRNTNNSYGAISDIKLKENIVDANSQWSDIKALRPVNYNFKEGQTHTQIGLIAQEVELVSPGLVTEAVDRDEDGNDLGTVTKSVNYSVLYMKAVKALQEAMERIETLEAKVGALETA